MPSFYNSITGSATFTSQSQVPAVGSPVTAQSVATGSQILLNNDTWLYENAAHVSSSNTFTEDQYFKQDVFVSGNLEVSGTINGGYTYLGRTIYKTQGSYTHVLTDNTRYVEVTIVGGGGGGACPGAAAWAAGSGGGGGATQIAWISVEPGDSYDVVVGSGGSGGDKDNVATAGTSSSFGNYTADAGEGAGFSSPGAGGEDGAPSFGLFIPGGPGGHGFETPEHPSGSFGITLFGSGKGGDSTMGYGGMAVTMVGVTVNGKNGTGGGSGGSGGVRLDTEACSGGDGSQGIVIIKEYG